MELDTKLLPCPFCGGDAELDTGRAYRALSDGTIGSRAVVYCTRCGADVGFCYEDARGTPREDIVNQVVDDWNRRVSPSQGEEAPAGEKRHGDVSEAMVEAALNEWFKANRAILPEFGEDHRRDMRAALTAALAAEPGETVAVKPLEWQYVGDGDHSKDEWFAAPQTHYVKIYRCQFHNWRWVLNGSRVLDCDTTEAAKAAAQADYERRILPALAHPLPLKEEVERVLARVAAPSPEEGGRS